MQYINRTPNPSGAYPSPQSNPAPSLVSISDELVTQMLEYNGFVSLTVEGDTVTAVTPDLESWEEWRSSLPTEPVPEPTQTEQLRADVDFIAVMTGVQL